MSAPVSLAPVSVGEQAALLEMVRSYFRELSSYEPGGEDPDRYFELVWPEMLDDATGREVRWITSAGRRAGFLVVRVLADWPDTERTIASIAEFYIAPSFRRSGVGTAAVKLLLAEHRRRGTDEMEADILVGNQPAQRFWQGLGFTVQFLQTGRKP